MLYTTLHNRILRLVLAVLGELIAAAALNLFIVPLSLYTGGLLGFCQLVRTLLQDFLGVSFGAYDIAGVFYFLLNIPLLIIGYRNLGRGLAVRTIICTVSYSVFYSLIPIPTQPIVDDYLTACLLGGILPGIGSGIVLTSGGSGGGDGSGEEDELLMEAIDVVLDCGQASVSMLQRRLKLGYSRAARIVDQMEERGIVGPFEGSKPRQILISKDDWREMKMRRAQLP